MKRYNFHFPEPLMAKLRQHADLTDITVAEILRRAAEKYLEAEEKKQKRSEKTWSERAAATVEGWRGSNG